MPSNCDEVFVDVPYGKIAAKVWGTKTDDTVDVIAIHGFMDNCGSFDRLIPLLDKRFYIVAFDVPGHGCSSQLPAGIPYTDSTWITSLQAVVNYFKFDNFTIFGHSMGSVVALYYATLYPTRVKQIVSFDTVTPVCYPLEQIPVETAKCYNYFDSIQKKNGNQVTPSFEPTMAVRLFIAAHKVFGELTEEAAKLLMKRSTKSTADGTRIVFTKDERLQCTISMLPFKANLETLKEYYVHLKCDLLVIRGTTGHIQVDRHEISYMIDVLKKSCKRFKLATINGGHYSLLTHPEEAVESIHEFVS